jgi:hypothetical protein
MMTGVEHLAGAKERALEYVAGGDPVQAVASLVSELGKHTETRKLVVGPELLQQGSQALLDDFAEMNTDWPRVRRWVVAIDPEPEPAVRRGTTPG